WTPDGKQIVTGGGDATVRLWDADTGKERKKMRAAEAVPSVKCLPDGKRAISCDCSGAVAFWDLEKGEIIRSRKHHTGRVYG
ncbi:WD40 repeat domain-containing protein, partial [Salmonella sp. SAL4360]|uniref:WD40 repeat domain-containing protein n=1 Tax=Salmonella sp. SAL4360 TaxID=3159881 RepID=UPI00397C96FA